MKAESILEYNMNKKNVCQLQMVENINRDLEKAEIHSIYFYSVFGMKQVDVSIPYDTVDKI